MLLRTLSAACLLFALAAQASAQFDPATADPDASDVADNGDVFITFREDVGLDQIYRFARWDGTTWTAYDSYIEARVFPLPRLEVLDITPTASGDALWVGGSFAEAVDASGTVVPVQNVARLDLATDSWSALGAGVDGPVFDLDSDGAGGFVAGGQFTASGPTTLNYIGRWDGTAWSSIGGGVGGAFPEVRAIALEPGGDLVATGGFETAFDTPGGSGTTVNYVARWDASGGTWQPLGPGFDFFPNVRDIESDGTTVVASGAFLQVGGVGSAVYRWDGAAWAPWQGVVPGTFMRDLTMDGQGTLYLVPDVFFPSAVYARQVGDPAWTLIGTENLELFEMVAANARRPVADAYLGGVYFQIDVPGGAPVLAQNHARWDGVRWRPLATGSTGNTPPVITSLFGPTLGDEGSQFAYNANGFDLDGDPLTYTWDFGDGSPVVSELERDTLTHIYADDGVYTLTVTVSDGGPVDAVATQIVTVDNVDPTIASLTGDLMGVEGNTFAYTAAATDPAGANDPLTYTWDFGDGTAPASGVDLTGVSHVYATDGAYTLSLTVTDGDGGSASGSLSVTVTDAPVGLPNVTIAVTTTTTTVPAGGGLLAYTIRVTNNEPTPQTADLWLLATTPTGNEVRVRRPRSVTLPPLRSVAASFTKQVPGIAPAGTYVVTGRLGEMASGVIYSADTFTFDKAASRPLAGASETFDAEVEAALVEILELDDDIAFEEIGDAAHPSVALVGARPNPFADRLSVDIALVEATKARLALYDARGREVAVVAEARLDAGRHTLALDARGLPSGVYLLRLQTGEAVTSRRVTLVR